MAQPILKGTDRGTALLTEEDVVLLSRDSIENGDGDRSTGQRPVDSGAMVY
jgi:hypothetical protein